MSNLGNKIQKFLVQNEQEFIDNFWLGLGDTSEIQTGNIFDDRIFQANPVLGIVNIMRNPDYMHFTFKHLFNLQLPPFQAVILKTLYTHDRPLLIGSRGASKSSSLGFYALYKGLFDQGIKIVVTGAAFRQAKLIFEYMEGVWKNSPMLRDILSVNKDSRPIRGIDKCTFGIGDSYVTCIPTGNGDKVRGLRAGVLIADERNSIPDDVFNTIFKAFGAVSTNPVEKMKSRAKLKARKLLGHITSDEYTDRLVKMRGNQSILSGTCGYTFEPLFKEFKQYRDIIMSRGDLKALDTIFNGEIPENFNYRDYAILRIPYSVLPDGFMDEKTIGHARATMHRTIFLSEMCAVFASDSDGFYKRSMIERTTVGQANNPIYKESCGLVHFEAEMKGNTRLQYIMGVDPASEVDNFAIVIIELHPDHRRIKYCWTINKDRYKARLKKGLTSIHNYYNFCARKIMDLTRLFPCIRIVIDAQGGGGQILQCLGDPAICLPGEEPFYEIREDGVDKDTDNFPGRHIVEMIEFADAAWVREANHGLRDDIERQTLLFPVYNSIILGAALANDVSSLSMDEGEEYLYDSLENNILEIQDIKNELITIEHTKTESGRDHWDTPKTKDAFGKKGRLRKDRYSALLMANMAARQMIKPVFEIPYTGIGGNAQVIVKQPKNKKRGKEYYVGPSWWTDKISGVARHFGVANRKNN